MYFRSFLLYKQEHLFLKEKSLKMKDAIEPIFNEWLEEHGEPAKTENFSKIFSTEQLKWDFIDVLTEERRESFKAGFKTAINLIIK